MHLRDLPFYDDLRRGEEKQRAINLASGKCWFVVKNQRVERIAVITFGPGKKPNRLGKDHLNWYVMRGASTIDGEFERDILPGNRLAVSRLCHVSLLFFR
jgi:hypothetical protein